MKRKINKQTWAYFALSLMVVAFFLISRLGFLWGDDYAMGYGDIHSFSDVIASTFHYYQVWGGGLFSFAAQFLFFGWHIYGQPYLFLFSFSLLKVIMRTISVSMASFGFSCAPL